MSSIPKITGSLREQAEQIRDWATREGRTDEVEQLGRELLPMDERETLRLAQGSREIARLGLNGPDTVQPYGSAGRVVVPDYRGVFLTDAVHSTAQQSGVRSITSGTTIATAGKLPLDVADTFIDRLVAEQPTLGSIQVRRMNGPAGRLDSIAVAAEKIRKATEGVAPSDTNAVSTSKRDLATVEVIWAEDITLSFLEDNIEKRNAEAHIASILATAFGNDLEQLAWRGDEGSGNAFININDGFIDLMDADGSVVDSSAAGFVTVTDICFAAYKALPVKYRNMSDLVFYFPHECLLHYAGEVSVRETALGDRVQIEGNRGLTWFGIPLIGTTALTTATAKGVLTSRSNLVFAIQRAISLDAEWRPRTRTVEYTLTARCDFNYATSDLCVEIAAIPAALL